MANTDKTEKVACCPSIATQRATFGDLNATPRATPNATGGLKALAGAVLRRNTPRNTNATTPEKQRNFNTEKNPEKLRSVAGEISHRPETRFQHFIVTDRNGKTFDSVVGESMTIEEYRRHWPQFVEVEGVVR